MDYSATSQLNCDGRPVAHQYSLPLQKKPSRIAVCLTFVLLMSCYCLEVNIRTRMHQSHNYEQVKGTQCILTNVFGFSKSRHSLLGFQNPGI